MKISIKLFFIFIFSVLANSSFAQDLDFVCEQKLMNNIAYRSQELMDRGSIAGQLIRLPNTLSKYCSDQSLFKDEEECRKKRIAAVYSGGLLILGPEVFAAYLGLMYLLNLPIHIETMRLKRQLRFDFELYSILKGTANNAQKRKFKKRFKAYNLTESEYLEVVDLIRKEPGFCSEPASSGSVVTITDSGLEFLKENDIPLEMAFYNLRTGKEFKLDTPYEILFKEHLRSLYINYNEVVSYKKFDLYLREFLDGLGFIRKRSHKTNL